MILLITKPIALVCFIMALLFNLLWVRKGLKEYLKLYDWTEVGGLSLFITIYNLTGIICLIYVIS